MATAKLHDNTIEFVRVGNGVMIRPVTFPERGLMQPLNSTVVFDDLKTLQAFVSDWWANTEYPPAGSARR